MSVERTFGEMSKPVELYKKLYELCESLSEDLVSEHFVVRKVVSGHIVFSYLIIKT